MTKKFTKEEKTIHYKNLREQWKANKLLAEEDKDTKNRYNAILNEAGGNISYYAYYWTLKSMQAQGLEGEPYIDAKTFDGWIKSGFRVKKGEKSKIDGITWLAVEETGEEFVYPKVYHLFHRSQVEEIK